MNQTELARLVAGIERQLSVRCIAYHEDGEVVIGIQQRTLFVRPLVLSIATPLHTTIDEFVDDFVRSYSTEYPQAKKPAFKVIPYDN